MISRKLQHHHHHHHQRIDESPRNRHVQRVHMQPQTGEADVSPVAQLDTQPDVQPSASPLAEQRAQRKTGSDETGAGKRTAQQPAVPEVQPPAAQDVSNILRVVEAKKPKKACGSGQKQQSSLGSRKERTVPSTKNPTLTSLRQGSDPISFRLFLNQRQSGRV